MLLRVPRRHFVFELLPTIMFHCLTLQKQTFKLKKKKKQYFRALFFEWLNIISSIIVIRGKNRTKLMKT